MTKGAYKRKPRSEETKQKISLSMKGRKASEETKKLMSIAHKGHPGHWLGKKMSEETKAKMSAKRQGSKHPNWKGGQYTDKSGYIYLMQKNHPFRNCTGYVKRSRLVMEKHIEKFLEPEEQIHHKGIKFPINSIENRQDDTIENLKLFASNSEHIKTEHNTPGNKKKHKFPPIEKL